VPVANFLIVIEASMNILFIIEVIIFSLSFFVSLAHVPKVRYLKQAGIKQAFF
jgi:hypothetical protein